MPRVRASLLAVAAGFGVALLALAVFHTTTGGNCASGPAPFEISNPCPANEGYWMAALIAGLALTAGGLARLRGGLTTGVIFLTVGGACLAAVATGDADHDWLLASIVLAVVFLPLGAGMLWVALWASPRRPSPALLLPALLGAAAGTAVALAIPGPLGTG